MAVVRELARERNATPRDWRDVIARVLPDALSRAVFALPPEVADQAVEVRIRLGRPLMVATASGECFVDPSGRPTSRATEALHPDRAALDSLLARLSGGSVYAVEEQIRQGFITLPGGHRVGLAGRVVVSSAGAGVQALTDFAGAVIRIGRAVPGVARTLVRSLMVRRGERGILASSLVLAPPGAGKTTLLRDLARIASSGEPGAGLAPSQVTIVDERSELAGTVDGEPQFDVGPRTDVLDRCPKAEGVLWALRALSPEVIVTDEIGGESDARALGRAAHSGCTILASAHAESIQEARRRPGLSDLLLAGVFQRAVVLSRRCGPGTVESVARITEGER